MYSLQDLTEYTKCNLNNEEKMGKVLAVATYVDRQQVCFLIEGDKLGIWTDISDLVGLNIQTSKANTSHISTAAVNAKIDEKLDEEIEEDIHFLIAFSNNLVQSIQNKATRDIETFNNFIAYQNKAAKLATQETFKASQDIVKISLECLTNTTKDIKLLVTPLRETIVDNWNNYWLERLFVIITGVDTNSAKNDVINFNKSNPEFSSNQIAQHFIDEKTFWSIAVGIVGGTMPAVGTTIDLLRVMPLLAELVYQVGISYGFENPSNGEILGILGLSFGADQLRKLGLNFLLKNTPIASWIISPTANALMFLSVGYTACQFYEMKCKGVDNPMITPATYDELMLKVKTYLVKAQTEINNQMPKITEKAMILQEELATAQG